jgi:hypothetical protein
MLDAFFSDNARFKLVQYFRPINYRGSQVTLNVNAKKNKKDRHLDLQQHWEKKVKFLELFDHVILLSKEKCSIYGNIQRFPLLHRILCGNRPID